MPRALVTGITGQDGHYLAERLVGEGVDVHGMVHEADATVPDFRALHPRVHLHTGDLADQAGLTRIVHDVAPDELYNLAGISSVALSWQEPILTAELTGVAAAVLFAAALQVQESVGRSVRCVQASSAEIFGSPEQSPQDERTPLRPVNPYGAAKAYAHHMAGIFRSRGLEVSTCILFNHESPRRPTTFVTRTITEAVARISRTGRGTLALGNLEARRDWGWAPDYVDAIVRAARRAPADDYVIATGATHSVADFAREAFAHVGILDWERWVVTDPALERPVDAAELVGDASRARTLLGWSPSVDFAGLVARMVDHDLALLDDRP